MPRWPLPTVTVIGGVYPVRQRHLKERNPSETHSSYSKSRPQHGVRSEAHHGEQVIRSTPCRGGQQGPGDGRRELATTASATVPRAWTSARGRPPPGPPWRASDVITPRWGATGSCPVATGRVPETINDESQNGNKKSDKKQPTNDSPRLPGLMFVLLGTG